MRIPIDCITISDNVRADSGDLTSLVNSIAEVGQLQPVLVCQNGEGYVLVVGERRVRAAKHVGLDEVEAVLLPPMEDGERILLQLSENMQRQNLTAIDEAYAFTRLVNLGWKQADIARWLSVSPATITQRMKLLTLNPWLVEAVERGDLPAAAGEELARLPPEQQDEIGKQALKEPKVRRVRHLVDTALKLEELQNGEREEAPGAQPTGADLSPGIASSGEVAALKQRLAEECGLDADEIMDSRLAQYDLLLSQGIGVSLSIGGGTLFRVHLPRELLGLSLDSEAEEQFHEAHIDLGEFFLAPKEEVRLLTNIEGNARAYLRRSVLRRFGFEFEPGWIWVPIVQEGEGRGFHEVKAKLEVYKASYLAMVEDLAARAEQIKAATLADVERVAGPIYDRLNGGGGPPPEFVENLKAWIEANFPTAAAIKGRAYFYIRYRVYPMPSQFAEDEAKADAVRERQRLLLEHQEALLEQERQAKEAMLDPMIHSIAQRLESLVGETVASVTRALRKGGQLPTPTLQRVRNLVQELGPLNMLVGSADLQELTRRVERLSSGAEIDGGSLSGALSELQEAAQKQSAVLAPDMMLYLEF